MSYDDIIPLLGDFGRYQRRIYFLLCLPAILCAFHKLGNVFMIAEPNYRCQLPDEYPNASYQLNETVLQKYFPWDPLQNKYSSCEIIIDNKTRSCENFIFDHEVYGYTSVIEFQLECRKAYLTATSNALFMVGVMIGSIVFGEMSDRYGRKLIFFISLVTQLIFGLLAAISPEYWTFTISRAVVGATTSGVFLVAYVIGNLLKCSFSRSYFFEIWASLKGQMKGKHEHILSVMLENIEDVENADISSLDKRVLNLWKSVDKYWKVVNSSKSKLFKKYSDWFN